MDNDQKHYLEPKRTLGHLLIPGLALIALIPIIVHIPAISRIPYILLIPHSQYIYLSLFVIFLISETIRLRSKRWHDTLMKLPLLKSVMREEENKHMMGATGVLLGLTVANFLLPLPLFILAVVTLTLTDPSARIMGKAFGKKKICEGNPKTVVGFCTAWAVGSVLFSLYGLSPVHVVADSFLVAYMEAFSRHKPFCFDDNNLILSTLALIWM